MIQNSLDRLFSGIAHTLRIDVLPQVEDEFAASQVAACIELLGNLSTRVDWKVELLVTTTTQARAAVAAAELAAPELTDLIGPRPADSPDDPLSTRNAWLAYVSRAIRACDSGALDDAARQPLTQFSIEHLESELALLRTGRFG